jgi:hypothetical protein
MTLYLTRSSCLWTFQLLGLEMFQVRLQKKATSTVSIGIHKGAIFDGLKIKTYVVLKLVSRFIICFLFIILFFI